MIVAVAVLGSLSACATGPGGGCTPSVAAGKDAALVTAKGQFGDDPKAGFPTPLVAKSTQSHVISSGEGAVLQPGETGVVQITIYDATSGSKVVSSDYTGSGFVYSSAADSQPAFATVAQCATVGSRVAAVGTAGALIGLPLITSNSLPFAEDDTIVIVVDLLDSYLGRANGADQLPQAGLPSIVLAPDGRPGFTIPSADPPSDLRIAALKAGRGAEVEEGDAVVLNYTGVIWGTKSVFDSTWGKAPAVLTAKELDATGVTTGGLVPGFAEALIGSRVGSQVLVVIPPEFGYPAGSGPPAVPDGSTMVFVFDVLGIVD
jgi:peptidylprolyl isomerase